MAPHEPVNRGSLLPAVVLIVLLGITGVIYFARRPPPGDSRGAATGQVSAPPPGMAGAAGGQVGEVSDVFRQEVSALEARLSEDPADTLSLLRLGDLMLAAHQAERSAELYRRLTEVRSANPDAWLGLARAYAALGRWDDALAAAESLLALDPASALARYNLAAVHANRGERDEAIRLWEAVAQDGPPDLAERARKNLEALRGGS